MIATEKIEKQACHRFKDGHCHFVDSIRALQYQFTARYQAGDGLEYA